MNHALALGTVWSLLVATVSVAFAVFSHQRQVNATVYLELTRQLHELYKRMPKRAPESGPNGHDAGIVRDLVFDSLQLTRTAYTLSRAGYLSGRLRFNLLGDAEKALKKQPFRELWPGMKNEFQNDPEFVAYVERTQA